MEWLSVDVLAGYGKCQVFPWKFWRDIYWYMTKCSYSLLWPFDAISCRHVFGTTVC